MHGNNVKIKFICDCEDQKKKYKVGEVVSLPKKEAAKWIFRLAAEYVD